MNSERYVELQVVSNFSFLRGASRPEELVARAASLGYSKIALTDFQTLSGIVRAQEAAIKHNIGLVVGVTIEVYNFKERNLYNSDFSNNDSAKFDLSIFEKSKLPWRLVLYATSVESYGSMCQLLTIGKSRAPKGRCFICLEDLAEHTQGLLAALQLEHWSLLPINKLTIDRVQENSLHVLKDIFTADRLSLILQKLYRPQEELLLAELRAIGNKYRLPLLATNDVHFHLPERSKLQDVLTCIRSGSTLEQAGYQIFSNGERYLKSPSVMSLAFNNSPQALERSVEIAERAVAFNLKQLRYEYPREICPDGKEAFSYLTELVWEKATQRYPQGLPAKVSDMLKHELSVIAELEYAKYFLTVYDIVCFARNQGILCQGRGAAANSAVCFVLGITAVDPDRINLLFERFVSRERDEPPDIDIDFEHERREEVIQYIYRRFGRHRAALVAAVITYRTRSAVRDIGKVFGLSDETIRLLAKLIRRSSGNLSSAELVASGLNPQSEPIQQTLALVPILKGFPRHLSQHVGGFIISEKELSRIVPIENAAMADRTIIEWDKDDIETMGMLKIDILALGMLTCIRKNLTLVNDLKTTFPQLARKEELSLDSIPAEDQAVYAMLSQGDSIGVFQVESRAQMSMLPRLRPKCFYDLVVEVAIVRPGPIAGRMVHPYLRRRNGQEPVTYPDEKVKAVLESTLGVPIFQEQVMQLAMVTAGFSGGDADRLRRAMSGWRKDKSQLQYHGEKIVQGMLERGYDREFAERVFEQIHGFGEYGFPQSHAASFALLVYVSAWLKHHYPAQFLAALLNSQPMGFYLPAQLIADAERHGVQVKPVDVNFSSWDCTITEDAQTVRLGYRLIPGLDRLDVLRLNAEREQGKFATLKDLWRRAKPRLFTLKRLAASDALQSLGLDRQTARWELEKYRDSAMPLFAQVEDREEELLLPLFSHLENVLTDYSTQGFSLIAHPLSFLRKCLNKMGVITSAELRQSISPAHSAAKRPRQSRCRVSGLVIVRQRPQTANGVVFVTLEDEDGFVNLLIRPEVFLRDQIAICDSVVVLAEGIVQSECEVVYVIADWVKDISFAFPAIPSSSRDFH